MFDLEEIQSLISRVFHAYAVWTGFMMMIRPMKELIPIWLRKYIESVIAYFFNSLSTYSTIVVDKNCGMFRNEVYDFVLIYLSTKISPTSNMFKVSKTSKQKKTSISIEKNQRIIDEYDGIKISWCLVYIEPRVQGKSGRGVRTLEKRFFELTFPKEHYDRIVNDYLPFVMERVKKIKDRVKVPKIYTRDKFYSRRDNSLWRGVNLDHPATFDTLAMDPDEKRDLMKDLDRFVRSKDYYKTVGRAWKRGYLLYGPTGTGKSSLVAAIANYLKFDIYDLDLTSINSNKELRRTLLCITNRSIIVIEDIDCSVEMQDRQLISRNDPINRGLNASKKVGKLTLSGLLNFIDGLWSSLGDERIIIFTTNYKDKIDPALLRPGRMDKHIHMSYCTPAGFKILAYNYQGITENHHGFSEIQDLIQNVNVTPAEIAEELMGSKNADEALQGLSNFIQRKQTQILNNDEKCNSESNLDEAETETKTGRISKPNVKKRNK